MTTVTETMSRCTLNSSRTKSGREASVSTEMLSGLFENQRRYMTHFFDRLQMEQVTALCNEMIACKGTIFFTGVGKSGFISQKVAQIFVSTGTKAAFLSPTDALHGDIGIVAPGDLVLMFSKSGNTEEMLKLLPFIKAKGARTVAVTCTVKNSMQRAAHSNIHLPLERELCPFDLAPVTSTAVQMLFGDTLAVAVMQSKSVSRSAYSMNHPAGRIGKRLMLTVRSVMLSGNLVPLIEDQPVLAALPILTAKACGALLVVAPGDASKLLGVFTDGDLRRAVQAESGEGLQQPVSKFMTTSFRSVTPDTMAIDALQEMESSEQKVALLPVIEDGRLCGLVTLHNLVSAGL